MFTPNNNDPDPSEELSDQEWEIRTGRAIDVLQQTLPDFFEHGLVAKIDPTQSPAIVEATRNTSNADIEAIYSPKVKLKYTPPIALPSPFPRTLGVEGLPLYMASSTFIRHTMRTLYSDLRVELRKMSVHAPPSATDKAYHRDKSVYISLDVVGTNRVSGGEGLWKVDSRYKFSPMSGLIELHVIDSIQPAPHQAAFDTIRSSLNSMFGFGSAPGEVRPGQIRTVEVRADTKRPERGPGIKQNDS